MRRGSRKGSSVAAQPDDLRGRALAARSAGRSPEESLRFAESVGDGLGRGLDPGSVRPIAALHFLGIETTASCDGHKGRGHAFPWIDVASEEDGCWMLEELSGWTLVQRGQGQQRTWRLNPAEINRIDDKRFDYLPPEHWQPARAELLHFADEVLGPTYKQAAAASLSPEPCSQRLASDTSS